MSLNTSVFFTHLNEILRGSVIGMSNAHGFDEYDIDTGESSFYGIREIFKTSQEAEQHLKNYGFTVVHNIENFTD